MRSILAAALAAITLANTSPANAQWDPQNAQWGKTEPTDVRVMTWNVRDSLCRTENKSDPNGNWAALARIVAALEPDVLILQETGDNSGNGTGSGVDSVNNLTTVMNLFFDGGSDPFNGGSVGEFVQLYRPGYSLDHIFVSSSSDNFNRNVIVSRWPFADLNGNGTATISDFTVQSNATGVPGGSGGIRGFQFAEINLPNDQYVGDLVIGNAHLKSGGSSNDFAQRLTASQNTWYYTRYLYNGNGTGTPDPQNTIPEFPSSTALLDPNTPIIMGGDLNEDENTNGRKGPAEWLARGITNGGSTDGNNPDGTDATFDAATEFFSGIRSTLGSSKLDYLVWQDEIATARREFVFRSQNVPVPSLPPELAGIGFPPNDDGNFASLLASDHYPVVVDFILPLGQATLPGDFALLAPADGATGVDNGLVIASWEAAADTDTYTYTLATDPGLTNIVLQQSPLVNTSAFLPGLDRCTTYYWSVDAVNANGSTTSTPAVASFTTVGGADQNGDGLADPSDFNAWVLNFNSGDTTADVNVDGQLTPADFNAWVLAFNAGCP
ncbi:MAG: GC-type dockerin domain-anchored protein [Planctomycetota bacterium]